MNHPRLAGRYAKSLLDLSIEQQQLEIVYSDMKFLQTVCKGNPDFVSMLTSPVIKGDSKAKIIAAITTERVSTLTSLFIKLLIDKKRESNLPEILQSFINQFNKLNDIHQVKITTAVPMSSELQERIVARIKATTTLQKIELETAVKDELIGGFTLEVGDSFVDASILRDLNDVKKQFKNNEFIHNLR